MLVKQVLLKQIEQALIKGIKATFLVDSGDDGDEMAESFAKAAAPGLADAIDAYIKSATIVGGTITGTYQGAPGAGAITGVIANPPTIQ